MGFVTAGLMNKQIAAEIGLSEITVKIHRGHVMKKMARDRWPIWFGLRKLSAFARSRRGIKPKYDFFR
jgi:regulatory LuxR family protein